MAFYFYPATRTERFDDFGVILSIKAISLIDASMLYDKVLKFQISS